MTADDFEDANNVYGDGVVTVTVEKPADQYEFWRRRLAGEQLPIHDGEYQAGFYRVKSRDGTHHPVAYWFGKDGKVRCRIGDKDVSEQIAAERWMWASKWPITHELYKSVIGGAPWPDQHEMVTKSNQAPPDDSFEGLKEAIDDLAREAARLISKGAAQTQDDADRASDLANRISDLQKKADGIRAAEKKPHDEAAKAVQAKWLPILDAADIYKRLKNAVVAPFLTKKQAAEREEREAAAKAGTPLPEQARSTTKAGTRGRSVALRTQKQVVIEDRAAVLAYFADGQQMTDFLQDMAERAVRAGVTPKGVKVNETQVAA